MIKQIYFIIILLFVTTSSYAQQNDLDAAKIEALEEKKSQAVKDQDFALASKLKKQIAELKNKKNVGDNPNAEKIAALEKQKATAVTNKDYALAGKIKKQIDQLKNPSASSNLNGAKIAALEEQKAIAVTNKDYALAGKLKKQIDQLKNPSVSAQKNASKIEALEKQKATAVTNKDYALAKNLKQQIAILKNPALAEKVAPKKGSNIRETERLNMKKQDFASSNTIAVATAIKENNSTTKIKKSEGNEVAKDLKYRRSSLYTLMINDNTRLHSDVIKDAFGNSKMPQKFNDHNVGPYLIQTKAGLKDQSGIINSYLNTNNIAKSIVAKWFNRSKDGKFNMDLIAARGMYDATAMDKVVANSTERGSSMLADAGIELIGNTFVIINDYKFTNKEELVAKSKKFSGFAKIAAGYVPGVGGAIQKGIAVAETAATVAGKGYIIKSTSYLYRLVWTEETEAIFYQKYWVDNNNFDPAKVAAFNKSTDFKLELIGAQDAWADVQSSIFTNKNEQDLIRMATVKATDKAIAKLEKKYEAFRTKTPLYSGDPITAKIGLKEDLNGGDKFEVLEQVVDITTGKTSYKRVGIIKVDGSNIWDNSLSPEETEQLRQQGTLPEQQYTYFKGSGKYYPGQLIKQIN